jgi:hypothetical protein
MYQILKRWFEFNYNHLGYQVTHCYTTEDLITKFDILRFGRETEIKELNCDGELRKLLFDALFRQHGYRVDNDFTPLKEIKEFKL